MSGGFNGKGMITSAHNCPNFPINGAEASMIVTLD